MIARRQAAFLARGGSSRLAFTLRANLAQPYSDAVTTAFFMVRSFALVIPGRLRSINIEPRSMPTLFADASLFPWVDFERRAPEAQRRKRGESGSKSGLAPSALGPRT